jgi:purine catabolism regulator
VRTRLEHDRRTDRAAQELHVHPNTLLYRIHRFEQISNRSLTSTEAVTEVWLALRAERPAGLGRLGAVGGYLGYDDGGGREGAC